MEIILGIIVSLVAQASKKSFGTSEYETLAITGGLALVGALIYTGLTYIGYWDAFRGVLTTAGAFYAFIITRFPNAGNTPTP